MHQVFLGLASCWHRSSYVPTLMPAAVHDFSTCNGLMAQARGIQLHMLMQSLPGQLICCGTTRALCNSCFPVSCWCWRQMEPEVQLEGMGQWLQCLLPRAALPLALSSSSSLLHLSMPIATESRSLGDRGADLRLLLLDEALVLAQHRARGGVGALLEQGPRGCGVCGPGLRALQP